MFHRLSRFNLIKQSRKKSDYVLAKIVDGNLEEVSLSFPTSDDEFFKKPRITAEGMFYTEYKN